MKHTVVLFLFICLNGLVFSAEPSSTAQVTLQHLSDSLNECIKHRQEYVNRKENRIKGIKRLLDNKSPNDWQRYNIYNQLSKEYKKFVVDSAIFYTLIPQHILLEINLKY